MEDTDSKAAMWISVANFISLKSFQMISDAHVLQMVIEHVSFPWKTSDANFLHGPADRPEPFP